MKDKFEIDFLDSYTKENIIEELKRISKIVGGRVLTKKDIQNYGRVSYCTIWEKFGGLSKAVMAAGLKANRYCNVTDMQLLESLIELWSRTLSHEGRRPQRRDLRRYNIPFSGDTYQRRFGSWKKALIAAYNSVGREETITNIQKDLAPQVTTPQRSDISIRKRFLVFKRDEFTCVMCGRSGRGVKLEVDHIIPVSKDGTDDIDNLQTLCFECNRGKRNNYESKYTRE